MEKLTRWEEGDRPPLSFQRGKNIYYMEQLVGFKNSYGCETTYCLSYAIELGLVGQAFARLAPVPLSEYWKINLKKHGKTKTL